MSNVALVIITSLLSGLLGAIVTNIIYIKNERRKLKLSILRQLIGNRYDIRSEVFTVALNSIFIVFYDSKDVILAYKAFHEDTIKAQRTPDVSNQKLLDLFKAMCKEMKIDPKPLTDNYFLQAFNIKNYEDWSNPGN